MRNITHRDEAIRARTKTWLESLPQGLTNTAIAVEMMPQDRRERLQQHEAVKRGGKQCVGQRRLQQDSSHKTVAKWRTEKATISADGAFRLGEALRSLQVPRTFGLQAAYTLGHAVEVGRTLVALSHQENGLLPALAFYVALPLLVQEAKSDIPSILNALRRTDEPEQREVLEVRLTGCGN